MKYVSHILLLLLVCAVVFGFKAGERNFWGRHGEARRAEVSREMVASGNWVIPHLNGEAFVTKPPLYYWAAAWIFTLTGNIDELSARIPSIISGTLGVLVTYTWASVIFSTRVGLFSGIILATSFLYGGMARTAGVDMMLTCFTTAALGCFSLGYTWRKIMFNSVKRGNSSTLMYCLTALWLAFGTLTKNPIGFAVPLLAIGLFILVTRDFQLIVETKPWWLLIIFLLIVLPWFILVYLRIPNFFEVLKQETLGRIVDPEGSPHYEPFYYYFLALGAFFPWVIFLPGVIISLVTKKKQQLSDMHLFLIIASVTTFGLFSSVGSKREYYLLPLYPLLAILVAKYWDEYIVMKKTTAQRWTWKAMDIPIVGFAGLLCFISLGLPVVTILRFPQYIRLNSLFGLLILEAAYLFFRMFFRRAVLGIFGTSSAATILLYLLAVMTLGPEMDAYQSRKEFFHDVATIVGDHLIVDYNFESYAPQFYMQRIIPIMHEVNELQELLTRNHPVYVFTTGGQYEKLQHEYPNLIKKFQLLLDRTWTSAINPKRERRLVLLKTNSSS